MATTAKVVVLFLAAFMSSTSLARPSFDLVGRQHVMPHWRDSGPYDYSQHGGRIEPPPVLTSPYYVEPSSRDLAIDFSVDGEGKPHSYTSGGGPIRSGYVASEEYRDGYPEDVPAVRYASSGAAEGGWSRGFYPRDDEVDGYPAVMTQQLDHKVGEIKLRNDHGYQLSMHVPPSSLGDQPGVLKIDMKATLYKPVYY